MGTRKFGGHEWICERQGCFLDSKSPRNARKKCRGHRGQYRQIGIHSKNVTKFAEPIGWRVHGGSALHNKLSEYGQYNRCTDIEILFHRGFLADANPD
jgi:hypothetical protein